ncbi:MAG TPA: phage baseplate assembly protein V [Pyrinomonadaceae bacterium]|nr:phage baseplate assembly protein V [Pyrinomonadaceae bacterium]
MSSFIEFLAGTESKSAAGGFGIAPGVVKDNLNVLSEGRVQVHIPELPDLDPWARVVGLGAGSERGFLWLPEIDDEVLVAFNQNDSRDAYVIGGLWSTLNRPPASLPTDFITKRIIKTGKKDSPLAHTIEIDDLEQSIKVTTSTSQEIVLDPKKISISTTEGLLTITMNIVDTPPAVTIEATAGDINLSAPLGTIKLDAMKIDIQGELSTDLMSDGTLNIQGTLVKIN